MAYEIKRAAPVICLDRVDSTNTALKDLARQGAAHGTVIWAKQQTGGKGRLGRRFASPAGGIYLSILWRPELPPEQAAKLSCAGALAMCRAVERFCGISPDIKWPNDLLLREKKICGILAEASLGKNGQGYLVLGMGLNVNTETFPSELQDLATSLYLYSRRFFDIAALAAAIIEQLDCIYAAWGRDGAAFLPEYRRRCITPGREILVDKDGARVRAQALDISDDYALAIRWPDGKEEKKSFGEIFSLV